MPRVQFCQTDDGVRIAYWEIGEGPPVVHLAFNPSHIDLEWTVPAWREWYEELARHHRLIRFDPRGWGLSERKPQRLDFESLLLDLRAVYRSAGLGSASLLAPFASGPLAMEFAARDPNAVQSLIAWSTWAKPAHYESSEAWQALLAAADVSRQIHDLWAQTRDHLYSGQISPAHEAVSAIRTEAIDDDALGRHLATYSHSVEDRLSRITAPTLIWQHTDYPISSSDVASEIAGSIPEAHYAMLPGATGFPFIDCPDQALQLVLDFLRENRPPRFAGC